MRREIGYWDPQISNATTSRKLAAKEIRHAYYCKFAGKRDMHKSRTIKGFPTRPMTFL